jgi:hypothetical protein
MPSAGFESAIDRTRVGICSLQNNNNNIIIIIIIVVIIIIISLISKK